METFIMMYRTHCQRMLDTVVSANFEGVSLVVSVSLLLSLVISTASILFDHNLCTWSILPLIPGTMVEIITMTEYFGIYKFFHWESHPFPKICTFLLTSVFLPQVQNFITHFWQGMPSHIISVLECPVVVDIVAICDSISYKVRTFHKAHCCLSTSFS